MILVVRTALALDPANPGTLAGYMGVSRDMLARQNKQSPVTAYLISNLTGLILTQIESSGNGDVKVTS
jgi:hypothetical protein